MLPLLKVTEDGEATVADVLAESLDETNAGALQEELDRLADRPRLRLDLFFVESVSSLALAKLVALHRRASDAGGELALVNVQPFVGEVFAVTGLAKLFGLPGAGAPASAHGK
jgi:anti-sigma B factor antagonist